MGISRKQKTPQLYTYNHSCLDTCSAYVTWHAYLLWHEAKLKRDMTNYVAVI